MPKGSKYEGPGFVATQIEDDITCSCGGSMSVVKSDTDGSIALMHSQPHCHEFETMDPLEFVVTQKRRAYHRFLRLGAKFNAAREGLAN